MLSEDSMIPRVGKGMLFDEKMQDPFRGGRDGNGIDRWKDGSISGIFSDSVRAGRQDSLERY